MKRILIYIGLLAGGLLLGYWIFSSNTETTSSKPAEEHVHDSVTQMWTCSMHPQIMQPEPGDCPICGMELIPAETNADGLAADQFKLTETAMALANIRTTTVGGGALSDNSLKLSGKIQVNEEANAVQVAYFAGRIEKLNVNFTGEQVKRGQLLATIYSPELVAAQQELLTAAKMKENQPALYKAVRNKLKLWKLSDKQITAIETSGSVRENFPIFATVSGTVTEKLVQEGDYVKQGEPLYKIANLNSVWAVFDAYENQIRSIEEGQKMSITTNAYPDRTFEAKVSFIDPVLNASRRTVLVRAELENKNDIFKPGMFVEGELQTTTGQTSAENIVTVPKSAVLWTGERSLVYVKSNLEAPVFEMREVKLGSAVGDTFEVLEGLENGEKIVVNGTFTVDAAAQLQGKKSMMNASSGMEKEISGAQEDIRSYLKSDAYDFRGEAGEDFKQQLDKLVNVYLDLKNALIEEEETKSAQLTGKFMEQLEKTDPATLTGKPKRFWEEKQRFMRKHAQLNMEAETLKKRRENFIYISEAMIKTIAAFGTGNKEVFVNYCPMANSNMGAYWISEGREIKNPYYGQAMLSCGEIVKKIW
ncbi:MAG: efflux RND transporter periplasmic adaptor subunit [Salinimicrobium sp.]